MEIEKTNVTVETLCGTFTAQAQIESAIPLPNGVRAERVLLCEPEVRVRETLCTKDGVQVTGLLLLHITVETDAQAPAAFDATATFTHELSAPGATPDMTARVSAFAPSCSCRTEEGGLRMAATLLLRADVFCTAHESCIAGIADAKGLETQGETVRITRRTLLGAHSIRVRETLDAPDGLSFLRVWGSAEVSRTVSSSDGVLLDGTLTVTSLYYDGEGGAMQRTDAVPFSDSIAAETDPNPIAAVELQSLSASYDTDGALTVEALLSIAVYGTAEETASVLSDAYDSEGSFSCECKTVPCLCYAGERMQGTTLREPLAVPGHLKDVTRVLFSTATPSITDTSVTEAEASIDGLLLVSVVCRGDDGRLCGFKTDVPFSLRLEPIGTLLLPRVEVRQIDVTGSGRTLSCTVELRYGGEWYRRENVRLTTDVTPGAPRDPHEGILLYFPDEGETIFSIGKRFGIPTKEVRAQNPNLSDPPRGVVLLQRQ